MENGSDSRGTHPFWLVLPIIIVACFIVPLAVSGPKPGEEDSFWYVFVPGIALGLFPWAKVASLSFQGCFKAGTPWVTKAMYESDPRLKEHKEIIKKWGVITILTWITVFLAMMVGVGLVNAEKSDNESREDPLGEEVQNEHEGVVATRKDFDKPSLAQDGAFPTERDTKDVPPGFIENSSVHKRLQFYDRLIGRLVVMPFLAMLTAVVFLIRYLVAKWWKRENKVPLLWKIVAISAGGFFVLPILLTFMIANPMTSGVRTQTLRFLNNASAGARVEINGNMVDDPNNVISGLKTLTRIAAHHSQPMQRIRIVVADTNYSLSLELGRDSSRPSEYWVFYPGYRSTRLNEIGRITTDVFRDY